MSRPFWANITRTSQRMKIPKKSHSRAWWGATRNRVPLIVLIGYKHRRCKREMRSLQIRRSPCCSTFWKTKSHDPNLWSWSRNVKLPLHLEYTAMPTHSVAIPRIMRTTKGNRELFPIIFCGISSKKQRWERTNLCTIMNCDLWTCFYYHLLQRSLHYPQTN